MNGEEIRTTETGDRISVELLREYLTWTLGHDAYWSAGGQQQFR